MTSVLTGDLCGWPSDRVSVFSDRRHLGDLPDELVRLYREVDKVALFYFVGHGQIAPSPSGDTLCLGLAESVQEPARRMTTSLPFDAVSHALWHSPAETKIVILDCCYAGLAGRLGGPEVLDLTRSAGAYTLAASGEFAPAWYEVGVDSPPQTYFTKYLADVIEGGIPGEGPSLRLESIFHHAAVNLLQAGKPEPTSRAVGHAPRIVFARNRAFIAPKPGVPRTLTISKDIQDAIIAHARAEYPLIACGLVAGPDGSDRPERFIPITNAARSREVFMLEPVEQLAAYREMDERNEEVVILYHSRAEAGAYLSRHDIQYATENIEDAHYVIVAIDEDGEVEFRSHRVTATRVMEEKVSVVPSY